MSLLFAAGSPTTEMSEAEVKAGLFEALGKLGERKRVLAVPPDFTRLHSKAGLLTELAWEYYGAALTDVLPALGTHKAMTDNEIATHVWGDAAVAVSRARLAQRRRHAGRGAGRVCARGQRGQGRLPVAGAGEQASARWRA